MRDHFQLHHEALKWVSWGTKQPSKLAVSKIINQTLWGKSPLGEAPSSFLKEKFQTICVMRPIDEPLINNSIGRGAIPNNLCSDIGKMHQCHEYGLTRGMWLLEEMRACREGSAGVAQSTRASVTSTCPFTRYQGRHWMGL